MKMKRILSERTYAVPFQKTQPVIPKVTKDSFLILSSVFSWLHIGASNNGKTSFIKKTIRLIFPVFALLAFLDVTVMFTLNMINFPHRAKTHMTLIMLCFLSLVLWHAMYRRREQLSLIFVNMHKLTKGEATTRVPSSCFIRVFLITNFSLPFLFSAATFLGSKDMDYYCRIFYYQISDVCGKTSADITYLFLKSIPMNILSTVFSNLNSFLYCCLCFRCSTLLRKYRRRIEKIIASRAYSKLIPELGRDFADLKLVVDRIQDVFSLPSFLFFVISFMHAFILLARFIVNAKRELTLFFMIEHLSLHVPSGLFAFVVPACAAQVLREMERNMATFYRLEEVMVLYPHPSTTKENSHILMTLKEFMPVPLSAWEMIEFTGSTMPAVLGTLLTYGLLILNLNR